MRLAARSLAALLAAALLAGPAQAAPSLSDARRRAAEAEAAKKVALQAQHEAEQRAAAARSTLAGLAVQRAQALAKLRAAERHTLAAAERMADLDHAEQDAKAKLAARAAEIAPLLPLIERLSLYPAETLLVVPASPNDAARGLIVLHGITQRLEQEAAVLKQDEARLTKARADVARQSPVLAAARSDQEQAAEVLDRQIAATEQTRDAAEQEAEKQAARAATLAATSKTLHALIEKLEEAQRRERARHKAGRQEEASGSGRLLVPVDGKVVRDWGAKTVAGPAQGISYRAAPKARVVAPCAGRVAFAAPFRSYGKLVILSCGGGIDVVLAGFAALHVHAGERVRRGDPVGTMPDWQPGSSAPRPTLYVEVRRHGDPVDPGKLLKGG